MTKLLEWLTAISVLLGIWIYLITNKSQNGFVTDNYKVVLYSPIIFAAVFGSYAATTILYRVYTFNDCAEAAVDLQNEIVEAKENLAALGFKFKQ